VDEPVTTTEIYHVAPGYESDFYSWGNALLKELARSSSFLGGQVLDPDRTGGDWHLVHRWTDSDIAVRWLESAARTRWLDEAAPFARPRRPPDSSRPRSPMRVEPVRPRAAPRPVEPVRAPMVLTPTSVEPARPGPAPPPKPPPKWKTAVVTLIAVFPPVLFFNVTLIPQLRSVNVVLRTLVLCVGVTAVVTWVMMPRLQPLFRGWLNSSAQRGFPWRIGALRATTVARVRDDDDELPTRSQAALGAAPTERLLLAPADTINDLQDRYGERNSSRSGRASYLHQSSPDRRDPR